MSEPKDEYRDAGRAAPPPPERMLRWFSFEHLPPDLRETNLRNFTVARDPNDPNVVHVRPIRGGAFALYASEALALAKALTAAFDDTTNAGAMAHAIEVGRATANVWGGSFGKIAAIKAYRERTGAGLADSKNAVERECYRLGIS